MKNKWALLAMVFLLGLIGSPVFAFSPPGNGVDVGVAPIGQIDTASVATIPAVEHLGTVMEAVFTVYLIVESNAIPKLLTGPAKIVPERYDKA